VERQLSVDDNDVKDRVEYTEPRIDLLTEEDEPIYGIITGGADQDLDERDNPHFIGVPDEM
jgi:hypothetical protein